MSLLILDNESLQNLTAFALNGSPVKDFEISVNDSHKLYFKIKDVDLESWFVNKFMDNLELDLNITAIDNKISIVVDLYGIFLTVVQNIPLLDNIILFLCPKLKNIKGVKIISLTEVEIDLNIISEDFKINNICVVKSSLRPIVIDFSFKQGG